MRRVMARGKVVTSSDDVNVENNPETGQVLDALGADLTAALGQAAKVTKSRSAPQPKTGASKYLNHNQINQFNAAVKRRVGKDAYDDWRIIGRIYKKLSDVALNETGANDRDSRAYKDRFSEILAECSELLPCGDSETTTRDYRWALLNIEYEGEKFDTWHAEKQPRASNPATLWRQYQAGLKAEEEEKGKRAIEHQKEIARLQMEAESNLKVAMAKLRSVDGIIESLKALGRSQLLELRDQIDRLLETAVDDPAQFQLVPEEATPQGSKNRGNGESS
jgi:hypothetical protein